MTGLLYQRNRIHKCTGLRFALSIYIQRILINLFRGGIYRSSANDKANMGLRPIVSYIKSSVFNV